MRVSRLSEIEPDSAEGWLLSYPFLPAEQRGVQPLYKRSIDVPRSEANFILFVPLLPPKNEVSCSRVLEKPRLSTLRSQPGGGSIAQQLWCSRYNVCDLFIPNTKLIKKKELFYWFNISSGRYANLS